MKRFETLEGIDWAAFNRATSRMDDGCFPWWTVKSSAAVGGMYLDLGH